MYATATATATGTATHPPPRAATVRSFIAVLIPIAGCCALLIGVLALHAQQATNPDRGATVNAGSDVVDAFAHAHQQQHSGSRQLAGMEVMLGLAASAGSSAAAGTGVAVTGSSAQSAGSSSQSSAEATASAATAQSDKCQSQADPSTSYTLSRIGWYTTNTITHSMIAAEFRSESAGQEQGKIISVTAELFKNASPTLPANSETDTLLQCRQAPGATMEQLVQDIRETQAATSYSDFQLYNDVAPNPKTVAIAGRGSLLIKAISYADFWPKLQSLKQGGFRKYDLGQRNCNHFVWRMWNELSTTRAPESVVPMRTLARWVGKLGNAGGSSKTAGAGSVDSGSRTAFIGSYVAADALSKKR